ncbi:MAG: hypothetical protein CM15mP46_1900 [Alphaproteobacteria bacterium]|nr:MAG: hypothetical protein CM15mP46_1900 [Alphaproteobacteria bacterium]
MPLLLLGRIFWELHTGRYCHGALGGGELLRLKRGRPARRNGWLECHPGQGLDYDTVSPIAAFPKY